jgi:hypothetical protein
MKRYTNPQMFLVHLESADILTVSVGDGSSTRIDFGSDFAKGLKGGDQGGSNSMSWYDDFK